MTFTSDIVEQFWNGLTKQLSEDDIKELSYTTGATEDGGSSQSPTN
jgi:hypothetical protein